VAYGLTSSQPLLPVASRADADRLIGVLALADLLHAYGITEQAGCEKPLA